MTFLLWYVNEALRQKWARPSLAAACTTQLSQPLPSLGQGWGRKWELDLKKAVVDIITYSLSILPSPYTIRTLILFNSSSVPAKNLPASNACC